MTEPTESEARKLRAALVALYDDTAEYITINHLGDIHHNRSMQMARDALAEGEPQVEFKLFGSRIAWAVSTWKNFFRK